MTEVRDFDWLEEILVSGVRTREAALEDDAEQEELFGSARAASKAWWSSSEGADFLTTAAEDLESFIGVRLSHHETLWVLVDGFTNRFMLVDPEPHVESKIFMEDLIEHTGQSGLSGHFVGFTNWLWSEEFAKVLIKLGVVTAHLSELYEELYRRNYQS